MSLHTNGVLTLATIPFNLIGDGLYTFASADPNNPNILQIASSLDSKGMRSIKCERKMWLPQTANDPGAYYRDYVVRQIPKHSLMITPTIKSVGDQLAALNTVAFLDAMRRGEK